MSIFTVDNLYAMSNDYKSEDSFGTVFELKDGFKVCLNIDAFKNLISDEDIINTWMLNCTKQDVLGEWISVYFKSKNSLSNNEKVGVNWI